jgi:hypothetical protein
MTPEEKKLRAKDQRLQKNYFITLETRNKIAAEQEYKCGICGRPESDFAGPLQVDHIHFPVSVIRASVKNPLYGLAQGSLQSLQYSVGWIAVATLPHIVLPWRWAKTKATAIRLAKEDALPHSIRGLLCPGRHGRAGHGTCNRLLGRVDDVDWLRKAIAYLENPPARKVIDAAPKV